MSRVVTTFKEFKKVLELNHQSVGVLGVNEPGYGQGAHVGNWGVNYGNPSQGVRGTFGDKGDPTSNHLPQQKKSHTYPTAMYDPYSDKYLVEDEVKDLINRYKVKCKQNSEDPIDIESINSKTIEFMQKYLNQE